MQGEFAFRDATLRVTLLGGGFGECVVLETADRVAIVDSALGPDNRALPLSYLDASGRHASEVVLVAATHFDLDHVGGLTEVVKALSPQRFVVSAVFRQRDILAGLAADRRVRAGEAHPAVPLRSAEYLGAMEVASAGALLFAAEGTRCMRWTGGAGELTIDAWAPASDVVDRIHRRAADLADRMRRGDSDALATNALHENDISLVLSIRMAGTHVVLGGDLEASTDPARGWARAVQIGTESFSPQPIDIVKVPHHGSEGAVDDALWAAVSPTCVALAAPWVRGRGVLPTQEGLRTLAGRCAELWVTVDPTSLPLGPKGGRKASREICWVQATLAGDGWQVRGGDDAVHFSSAT